MKNYNPNRRKDYALGEEKYTLNYQCKFRQLWIMITLEEEKGEVSYKRKSEEVVIKDKELKLNLDSSLVLALDSPKTIKFIEKI